MNLSPIRFLDIQTTDLVYYDDDFRDVCFRFCQQRDIDCIPCLTNPKTFFRRTDEGFQEEDITPARLVDSQARIFEPAMLDRFHTNPILFVTTEGYLSGVVHFSDYNRPVVNEYLFRLISSYERSLRKLLCLQEWKNQDMLDYFQKQIDTGQTKEAKAHYQKKLSGYRKHQAENEKLPAFEAFHLLDLIEFSQHHNVIEVHTEPNDLRNKIMHAHDLIHLDDPYRGDYIYTLTSFEEFFQQVSVLLQDYQKVNNRIALYQLGAA